MENRKKILFLTHWYPNEIDTHRGIFIKNHAEAINTLHDVLVIDFTIREGHYFYRKTISRSKDERGMNVLKIDIESRVYKLIYYWLSLQSAILKRALNKEGVDVSAFDCIQSNVVFPSGIVANKLAIKNKVKLIHVEHWSHIGVFLKTSVHKRKAKKVLQDSEKVLVVSGVLKNMLKPFIPTSKMVIVPNVVNDNFSFLEKNKRGDTITFLAIANWRKPKNPFLFLNALEELSSELNEKFEVVLVGEGEQLDLIKKRNYTFPILFAGKVKNDALNGYFQKADFFVHGSDFETFSIVCVEALLTGTPVIGSKVGILPDVIDENNGVLCESTLESWVSNIKVALCQNYDHLKISESFKGRFSEGEIAKLFDEVYRNI